MSKFQKKGGGIMVKECNKRVHITMNKNSIDLIQKFAKALKLTMSQFVESVCVSHIMSIVKSAEKQRKELKDKVEAKAKN